MPNRLLRDSARRRASPFRYRVAELLVAVLPFTAAAACVSRLAQRSTHLLRVVADSITEGGCT
jgi:hypothetical protein